jgi:methylmalonyl-CoA/ethylmalonyl-CoA epimerase
VIALAAAALPDALAGLRLDHVAVAVADLDDAGAFALLGCRSVAPDEEVPAQGVVVRVLRAGDVAIELLAPTGPETPVGRFLARRGPGLHHLAFAVDDLEAEVARLAAAGASFVDPAPRAGRGGSRVVFLRPAWTGGVLVELVEHP